MLAGTAVVVACLVALSPWLASSVASSRELLSMDVSRLQPSQGWLLAGAAALIAIGSLAVYFVVAED